LTIKNYYHLLGVGKEASQKEIKKAYHQKALAYHPDLNKDKPGCEERLKEVNEAYGILGDEEKRLQYDLLTGQSYNSHVFHGRNLSDELVFILRDIFKGSIAVKHGGGCRGSGFNKRGCKRKMWKS